jgi:hypothetical protein
MKNNSYIYFRDMESLLSLIPINEQVMERIKLSKNFFLDEYIPQELYQRHEDRPHILIGLLDRRLLRADQKLRNIFGPVTINNWATGGVRNWSGIRIPGSPYYSPTSQHSWGRASDKLFARATPEEVRTYIKTHWKKLGITCIEEGVDWVHSDVRYVMRQKELLLVYP